MNRVAGSVGEAGATRFTLARFMRQVWRWRWRSAWVAGRSG